MGDHVVLCHGRGNKISHHDRIGSKIISACLRAFLSHICEKKSLLPHAMPANQHLWTLPSLLPCSQALFYVRRKIVVSPCQLLRRQSTNSTPRNVLKSKFNSSLWFSSCLGVFQRRFVRLSNESLLWLITEDCSRRECR